MLIPYLLFFGVYHYAPYFGIQIAFKDYSIRKGIWGSEWVGFENFTTFLGGPYFPRLLRNTFVINLYGLILGFPASPVFALLLNEVKSKMFKTTVQTITYLPHFISTVVIAGIVVNFLAPSGLMNHLYVGIKEFFTQQHVDPIYFLMKPENFRMIYTLMGIWAGFGFGSIVYTSAISGIDQELYEAAKIDGAGRWRQTLSITIPGIMPTIAIYLIMRVSHMLSVGYETIILLYQPVTYETADVISTYSYRMGLGSTSGRPDYSLSTAIGLFNGVVSLTLVTIANKISRKVGDVGLW
ncbi:MAG: sugar ABC transporter permease [Clostridia bacterium]|nr:sugar ABC transporter permease [Clostridia bacterium]